MQKANRPKFFICHLKFACQEPRLLELLNQRQDIATVAGRHLQTSGERRGEARRSEAGLDRIRQTKVKQGKRREGRGEQSREETDP